MARSSMRLSLLVAALAASAVAASAARAGNVLSSVTTALIGGNCGSTSQAFAPFGDQHSYYLTSDGGFEGGGAGWTFTGGAKVVAGNETSYLHSSSDRSSLLIPNGGTATSPATLLRAAHPGHPHDDVRHRERSTFRSSHTACSARSRRSTAGPSP